MESQPPNDQKPSTIEEEYEKEDEEDDEDFNPLALQILSPEASSSLSSDNEHSPNPKSQPFIPISIPQSRRPAIPPTEDEDEDEAETVMQTKEVSVGQATESAMGTRDDDVTNDAICRRTRARYSLANFTLEELETFLQETDDEDDFHNAGEEEDYRNFLAAVLNDDGGTEGGVNGNACVGGDDDEENDADFEVEIEEALESDDNGGGGERQPETRQKRRQKASARNKKRKSRKLLVQANAPLRPLLPSVSNGQIAPLPLPPLRPLNTFECCPPFIPPDHMMGFTAHQIGQLHCLIHEHVQLLVQVYSLSVLDPSRQQVANDVEKLILEMSCRRDEALARGRTPYLGFCFRPPHVQPSVSDECPQPLATQLDSSSSEGSIWRPVINGPVRSIVNVAPLSLVRRYVADVSMAVQAHKQRRVEAVHSSSHLQKEPLFPLPSISNSVGATNNEVAQEATPVDQAQQPKKSLAAMLVESTKHSVALVPKDIVTLAQRFFPLFNSTLFPHKPPPAAIANRVLFTDAEDELLAMGLMEYNNDWKAIQQRFLPCKSKHQIFVRQKNRSSSKAPENPIKAVRRMKTSPLTAEEKARIHEGLKVLKLDWMSVWKFCVPHRDPSLLPRQWRIALGTQKSYKSSDAAREKRRLYEKKRRNLKKVLARQIVSEKEDDNGDGGDSSADGNMDNEDEAYVHEAFLAGWKPGCSRRLSSELPSLINSSTYLQSVSTLPQVSAHGGEIQAGIMNECGGSASMHKYAVSLESSGEQQNLSHFAHIGNSVSYTAGSSPMTSSLKSKPFRPYRMRKSNAAQLVKLAPDLPPVNLPPSVRVISQSAFKTYNSEIPISRSHGCETENPVMKPHVVKSIATTVVESRQALPRSSTRSNSQQDPRTPQNQTITEDSGVESDLQMHPLLFQGPEDSHLPYLPRNSGSNGFSFFPGNPFHGNLNPFCKSQHAGSTFDCFHPALRSKETPSDLSTIDFHPLLQRSDNLDSDTVIGSSGAHISRVSESLQGSSAEISNVSNPILTTQQFTDDQCATNVASSPYEMANELDLDIHLSISNSKEKIKGNRARTEHDLSGSTEGALDHGNIEERQRDPSTSFVVNSHMNPVDNIGKIDLQRKTSADMHPVSHEVTLSSKAVSRYGEVNQGEQSLTEIVMEQEELSDSDEEIGEDVEFECEEMADSEGEELDCEQLTNAQNKVGWTVTSEEEIVAHGDHDRLTTCDPQSNICVAMGSTRSPKSGLTQKAKNTVTSSSDLCTPGFSGTKQKRQRRNSGEQDQSSGPCLSSRSTKRKPKKEGTMPQCQQSLQPHLSSTAAESNIGTPAKELRKRVCRMNPKTMDPNTVCSEPLPLPGTEEETESMPL